jgi:ribosomal protein S6--L-glutamate ligase
MDLAILSAGAGWHVKDLERAAREQNHTTTLVDFRRISAAAGRNKSPLRACAKKGDCPFEEEGQPPFFAQALSDCGAVIVRTMPPGSLEQVVFRMDVLNRLQAAGKRVLNPPRALEICIDKYLATARLEAAGLRVPATVVCQDAESAMGAFVSLGGDVVVKPLFGSEGRGMVRVSDPEMAWRIFRSIERLQAVLYLQQFVRHPGWDLRVFVIGSHVVAAMRRYAGQGWRTNVAQGGKGEVVRPTEEENRLALAAAAACGALVAGVDLLQGPSEELLILEVNAVPGWRALAPVTGIDVAAEIVRFAVGENKAAEETSA